MICFQHYKTFQEAQASWNRRKQRVNHEHCGIILIVDETFANEAELFDNINLDPKYHRILFTVNFEPQIKNVNHFVIRNLPRDVHFMTYKTIASKWYEQDFNIIQWLKTL